MVYLSMAGCSESDPAQLSSRACWGHLHEPVQGGGAYRGLKHVAR